MALKAYRQGDVMFYEVEPGDFTFAKSEERKHKDGEDIVLALGEATGHKHRVSSHGVREFRRYGRRFLNVHGVQSALVKHEEHNTVPLPKGTYEVVIEREYKLGGEIRAVAD